MVKAKAITQKEVAAREAAEEQRRVNDEARAYLRETDWYVIRNADTGWPVPDDIWQLRQEARKAVKDIDEEFPRGEQASN